MPPLCPLCGRPQISGTLCTSCISWSAEIDGIRSPFRFEGTIRQAIYQFKYKNLRTLVTPLARLLNDYLLEYPVPGEVLVPVPLHPKRLRERGYNQSGLLTHELGKFNNLPVVDDYLIRQRFISPQTRTLNIEERQNNVTGAFTCSDNRLQGRQVILIDDVATSGATLDDCARALKTAGVASVWGVVIAREI